MRWRLVGLVYRYTIIIIIIMWLVSLQGGLRAGHYWWLEKEVI